MEVLKLEAQVPDFPSEPDKIHFSNGTLLLNGTFIDGKEQIVQSHLPIFYDPNTPVPKCWSFFAIYGAITP